MSEIAVELKRKVKIDLGFLKRSVEAWEGDPPLVAEMLTTIKRWRHRLDGECYCPACDQPALEELRNATVSNHPDGPATDIVSKDDIC